MLKKIFIIIAMLIIYIGCVIWICDGIVLLPNDKFLICFLGALIIDGGITFPIKTN